MKLLILIIVLLLSVLASTAHAHGGEEESEHQQELDAIVAEICAERSANPKEDKELGLHIGAFFIVLATSSLGAFIPVLAKKYPSFRLPQAVFFATKHFGTGVILATAFIHMIPSSYEMLGDKCLPEFWNETYSAIPGALAMAAALMLFFIKHFALKISERSVKADKDVLPTAIQTDGNQPSKLANEEEQHLHGGTMTLLSKKPQTLGIIVLEMGICFHSVIIGMALSVSEGADFVSLLVALVFHQMFEGLGLGSRIAELDFRKGSWRPWLMSLAYGLTTPIGIAVGLAVRESYNPESNNALIVQGVLDSISAGILLYASMVELIANDFIYNPEFRKKRTRYQLSAFALLLFGAALMALIGRWA